MTAPADTLRQTAALIRKYAGAATPGPWHALTTGVRGGDHWYVCDEGQALAYIAADDGVNEAQRQPDAEYIASWHPLVALAVADWLDATAHDLDENSIFDRPESGECAPLLPEALWCERCGGAIQSPDYADEDQACHCTEWSHALTVATTYLGTAT